MKILSWNVRGIGSAQKRAITKGVITAVSPNFVILTETKLVLVDKKIIKSLWSSISINGAHTLSTGTFGGIIIMWDSLIHCADEVYDGSNSLLVSIKFSDNVLWWISGIYGPASRRNRKFFWEELDTLASTCNSCWILGGDFNVYRWTNETTSCRPSRLNMRKFNAFIEKTNLMEPRSFNNPFTWSNEKHPHYVKIGQIPL